MKLSVPVCFPLPPSPSFDTLSREEAGAMSWSALLSVLIDDGLTPFEARVRLKLWLNNDVHMSPFGN